jgi:hypothetical protein
MTSSMNIFIRPVVTFSQPGTALISFNIGDASPKGAFFLTSLMNLMHAKY